MYGPEIAGQDVPKRAPDSRQGVASAPPVPLPSFSLKSHKGDAFGKERLLGDFALLYLGSLANADHTKSSLERMLHIVQQQGSHLLLWKQIPQNDSLLHRSWGGWLCSRGASRVPECPKPVH